MGGSRRERLFSRQELLATIAMLQDENRKRGGEATSSWEKEKIEGRE